MIVKISDTKTEVSKEHFFKEGERIKIEDRNAIYEIRDPKELATQVDLGFARYDIILNLVDKYCLNKGLFHLDIGCGLGYLMAKMSQRKFKTSGIDISKSFLDIAEEKLKHWHLPYENLIEADLQESIKLPDAYFDIITSTDVLEHIENQEWLLRQIYRLMKPDGKAIISTNNYLSPWGLGKIIREKIFSVQCFHPIDKWSTFYSLKRMVQRYDFKVLEIRGTYFLPIAKCRCLLKPAGVYRMRYEINNCLSDSFFKYFARDIIFVLEKNKI